MTSESKAANVQALRNLFSERNAMPMRMLSSGALHPSLSARESSSATAPPPVPTPPKAPPKASPKGVPVLPGVRIPRPTLAPKPGGPTVTIRVQRPLSNGASAPTPNPPLLPSAKRDSPKQNSHRHGDMVDHPGLTTTTAVEQTTVLGERHSGVSWEPRKSSSALSRSSEEDFVLAEKGSGRLLSGSSSSTTSDSAAGSSSSPVPGRPGESAPHSRSRSPKWRRRRLPTSSSTAAVPPPKPPRFEGMRLPLLEPAAFQTAGADKPSGCAAVPLRAPPRPPALPPPRATPPTPLPQADGEEEDLYGDTEVPQTPSSPIPEYTEDEELGRRLEEELYADTKEDEAPALPPARNARLSDPRTINTGPSEEELYQDSTIVQEEMYEEMPLDKEKHHSSPSSCRGDVKDVKTRDKKDKIYDKLRKKFGLKGTEEPLETGRVKVTSRGSRLDLSLRKGETVVILRMDQNPPGKWLVRNDKGEVGYAELTNIEVMTLRTASSGSMDKGPSDSFLCGEEEEAIYEATF